MSESIEARLRRAIAQELDDQDLLFDADQIGELACDIADAVFAEFLITRDEQLSKESLGVVIAEDWK
jgi:hypothetical protein